MTIDKIRNEIKNQKGKTLKFKFNGSRNQTEEFEGTIESTYKYVFLIRLDNNENNKKTFSYTDILTENLEIHEK